LGSVPPGIPGTLGNVPGPSGFGVNATSPPGDPSSTLIASAIGGAHHFGVRAALVRVSWQSVLWDSLVGGMVEPIVYRHGTGPPLQLRRGATGAVALRRVAVTSVVRCVLLASLLSLSDANRHSNSVPPRGVEHAATSDLLQVFRCGANERLRATSRVCRPTTAQLYRIAVGSSRAHVMPAAVRAAERPPTLP
jgi:hypothetical protein